MEPMAPKLQPDPLVVLCEECRSVVRVTARGTLYRHPAVTGLREYCKGSGPRAPRKPPRGMRPDLSFPNKESAAYLLGILEEQDAARAAQCEAAQRGPRPRANGEGPEVPASEPSIPPAPPARRTRYRPSGRGS